MSGRTATSRPCAVTSYSPPTTCRCLTATASKWTISCRWSWARTSVAANLWPEPFSGPWNARIRDERRYVQQSIAHLVANGTSVLLDETAALRPSVVTASAADMEAMVEGSGLRWTSLRGGAFYGPRTGRDEQWRDLARQGALVLPGDGTG
jgi:hypothetical protein